MREHLVAYCMCVYEVYEEWDFAPNEPITFKLMFIELSSLRFLALFLVFIKKVILFFFLNISYNASVCNFYKKKLFFNIADPFEEKVSEILYSVSLILWRDVL